MTEEKMAEVFNKIYDALNDEQKAQARTCGSPEEFFAIADKAGVPVPDDFLDDISGGASLVNQSMYNQSTENKATINQATFNQSEINATKLNQAAINQAQITTGKPTGTFAIMPLGTYGTGSPVKTTFTTVQTGWGVKTAKKA